MIITRRRIVLAILAIIGVAGAATAAWYLLSGRYVERVAQRATAARLAALQAIGNRALDENQVPDALIDALQDGEAFNRYHTLLYLDLLAQRIRLPPEAVQALILSLEDPVPEVRSTAAAILATVGPDAKEAVPTLMSQRFDPNWATKHNAALALWRITGEVEPSLSVYTTNLRWQTFIYPEHNLASLYVVRSMGPSASEAADVVTVPLRHWDPRVRILAAETLESLGATSALIKLSLVVACDDPVPAVQLAASGALQCLFGIAPAPGRVDSEMIVDLVAHVPDEVVVAWREYSDRARVITVGRESGRVVVWDCSLRGGSGPRAQSLTGSWEKDSENLGTLATEAIAQIRQSQELREVAEEAIEQLENGGLVGQRVGADTSDATRSSL